MAGKKVNRLIVPNVYTANGIEPVTSVNNILPVNGNVTIPIPTVPTNVSAFTNDAGYLTSATLDGYATQSWVQQQGYLTSVPSQYITDTELSITLANYVTSANLTTILDDYATQQWVNNQGYITGITSSDVTNALGFTPYNSTNPDGYITSSALTPYALISSLSTVATSGLYSDLTGLPTIPTMTSQLTNNSGFITSADLPTNYLTTNTAQSISGQKTFTSTIKSSVDNSLALTLSTGDAFGVTVKRTDANNEIKFGIGQGGDNRGIWDVRHNKWAFSVTNDGKSYTLGNEIAIKSDLNSLSPLRYSRYSIAQVNSTNKFIKLASMTFTQSGNRDFSYLFWVEILEASTAKCYALVRLSARWSNTSYQGHKFEILEKYGEPANSLEALKNLTYAYSLDTTTHKITVEIWLEIKNAGWVSYYLRPTECNEYGDYSNTPVTLSNNVWTYYNQSGNASSIASTAITSGLTQVKVTDATGVRNENNLSQVMKMWVGTKAQYDAIVTKDANTLYNVEGVGLYKGTTLISGAMPNSANQSLSNLNSTGQAIIDGKADTDLSNLSTTGRKVLYSKPTISRIAIVTGASQHGGIRTYSLANYLPDDGSDYLVQISCRVVTASTSGAFMNCNLTSSLQTNGVQFCVARTRSNSLVEANGCGWMLIGSDRKLYHNGSDSNNYKGTYDIQAMAYIRVGSNS